MKNNILKQIVNSKHKEVEYLYSLCSLENIKQQAIDLTQACTNENKQYNFIEAITTSHKKSRPAIIAEIKKASPSKGIICHNFNVEKIAQSYANYGASCLSILTDKEYFMGEANYIKLARQVCN